MLEPERAAKTDKLAILSDAIRVVKQLRNEAAEYKEENKKLQQEIESLKVSIPHVSFNVSISLKPLGWFLQMKVVIITPYLSAETITYLLIQSKTRFFYIFTTRGISVCLFRKPL